MSYIQEKFEELYCSLREVAFDPKWKNGTGYFNGAVYADLDLQPGERVRAQCDESDRWIILIGTPLGNAVVFERYTPNTGSPFVLVSNVPDELKDYIPSGAIGENVFFGSIYPENGNVGTKVMDLYNAVKAKVE